MSARLVGWMPAGGRLDTPLGTVSQLGAAGDNDVVVRIDGVSKQHARIVETADGHWLEDAGSRNGTWLNGDRVTRARLRHLDVITLGRFAELVFLQREGEAAPPRSPDGLRVRLEWLNGPDAGRIIDLPRGETLIGRAESCAIVIDSTAVSRAHLRFTHTADSLTVEDLATVNGTTVNGERLTGSRALDATADIDVGQARRFRVLIEGTPRASERAEPGATPPGSQDMEWATRLVWSASDLEALEAAGVILPAGAAPGRSPAAARTPAPAAATRAVETPPAAAPVPPAKAVPPTPPTVRASSAPTVLEQPAISVPPLLEKQPEEVGARTKLFEVGKVAMPAALGKRGAGQPRPAGHDAGPAPASPGPNEAPAETAAPPAPTATGTGTGQGATVIGDADMTHLPPPPRPGERTNLPPSTILGYRDVAPPRTGTTSVPGTPSRFDGSVTSAGPSSSTAPIVAVTLTGATGIFRLPRGEATIGRATDATVRLDSREISRVHATVTVSADEAIVTDRGSVNGTSVNGARVSGSRALRAGDRVCFADFEFRVDVNRSEGTS